MHIRNSNNVNPRFYIVTCHCAGWDLLKAKVLWWILIEASLNIALNHFYTFYPVYLWPSDFISLIYFLRDLKVHANKKIKIWVFPDFWAWKYQFKNQSGRKRKKNRKKNSKYFNAYEKIIQGASPVWSPPTPLSHGRKGMVVAIRLSSILSRSTGACTG